jgi:hypothetical protein
MRLATFDTDRSVADSMQTIQQLHDSAVLSVSQHSSPLTLDVSGEATRFSIGLRLAVDFVHVMYMKVKQLLVFCI